MELVWFPINHDFCWKKTQWKDKKGRKLLTIICSCKLCKVFCHKDISSHLWPSVECYFDPVVFCECWEGVTKSFEHSSWLRTSWNMNGMLQVFVTLLKYIFYDLLVSKFNFNSNGYCSENVHFWVQSMHNSDPTHILNSRKSKHLVFIIMKMQGKIIKMKKYPMFQLVT